MTSHRDPGNHIGPIRRWRVSTILKKNDVRPLTSHRQRSLLFSYNSINSCTVVIEQLRLR